MPVAAANIRVENVNISYLKPNSLHCSAPDSEMPLFSKAAIDCPVCRAVLLRAIAARRLSVLNKETSAPLIEISQQCATPDASGLLVSMHFEGKSS